MATKVYERKPPYTYMSGNTKVTICEDYMYETQEEIDQCIKNIEEFARRVLRRKQDTA